MTNWNCRAFLYLSVDRRQWLLYAFKAFCFGIDPFFGRHDGVVRNEDSRVSKPIIGIFVPFFTKRRVVYGKWRLVSFKTHTWKFRAFFVDDGRFIIGILVPSLSETPVRRKWSLVAFEAYGRHVVPLLASQRVVEIDFSVYQKPIFGKGVFFFFENKWMAYRK